MDIFCDGSIAHNPGGRMKYAFVIPALNYSQTGITEANSGNTNWIVEFTAVKEAVMWCLIQGLETESIHVYSDLKGVDLLLNKANFKAKPKSHYPIAKEILGLKRYFKSITFNWIPREQNTEADALSKL